MREIAPGVAVITTLIANAYVLGDAASWVLVDACTPGNDQRMRKAAESRFGAGARPRAIVLTHGHFDHAGSAGPLADAWGVPVFAHPLELPYLTGQAHYPPFDRSSPGFFTQMARFLPMRSVNLGSRVSACSAAAPVPGLPDWEIIETPGHTPGHVSHFRRRDRILIAGDAVTTMNLDSFFDTVLRRREICRPPVPATSNWRDGKRSVELLASLRPSWVCAGHGLPVAEAAAALARLAGSFPIPNRANASAE